jgi:1-acyl-sn-glycerol-3-phosphate acyltransferase
MDLLSYLLTYLFVFFSLIPMYSLALLVGFFDRSAAWRIIVIWNRFFLRLFKIEVEVEYEDSEIDLSSGCVVVGLTQQSILDPLIGQAVAPKIFMSIWNIEYALIPLIGWVSFFFGWVIIRQWPKQAKKTLEKSISYIRGGGIVYLSLEGKRSKDGSLGLYKKGPVVLAIQANAKIIPVMINGTRDCLPYGEWKIRPGKVTMHFLKEISTEGMAYEDRDLLVNELRKLAEKKLMIRISAGDDSGVY